MKGNPEVKNRFTGKVIIEAGKYESLEEALFKNRAYLQGADLQGADLRDAYLRDAYLQDAYLQGADLQGADLRDAYLRGAYLRGADLRGAYLQDAYLRGADLQGAEIKNEYLLPDLYSLKLQPLNTKLRFWKYLTGGISPYRNFHYDIGKEYTFNKYEADEQVSCGPGGNVATLMWCLKDSQSANEFMEVEFKAEDIVAVPYSTDGKFRVRRFKTLRIVDRKEAETILEKARQRPE